MPKVIYQKEIINSIKQKTGLSRKIARDCLSIMKNEMIVALSRGESINLRSFGSFSLKKTKPRKYYNIHKKEVVELKGKNIVRFKKSKSLVLPMPQIRKRRSVNAMILKKRAVPYALRKQSLGCDIELSEFYRNIIKDKSDYLPYVWKLKMTKNEYFQLKGLLSWALEEYEYKNLSSNQFLKKHANIVAIYIAEWYKREYNNFSDENNDALKDLDLQGSTQEYNIIWQYSSKVFDINRFLYKSEKTNRTKHSLYVLGGIPLQFEYKKLCAIILECFKSDVERKSSEELQIECFEQTEDTIFLLENIYLRESLRQKDGSLHQFVTELKNGKYIDDIQNDEDYKFFVDNYIHFQNNYFCKNKFQNEWVVYYRKGCDYLTRCLRIHLNNEFSAEKNTSYISEHRLKQWNIPTEDLSDFSIYLKINDNCHKQLFQFSYTSENNYVCYEGDCVEIDDVPVDFSKGYFYLKSLDSGTEFVIPREQVEFNDVNRFFKTSSPYEWTDNSYINSTELAILCTSRYDVGDDLNKDVLALDDGSKRKEYYWIPFSGEINIIDTLTNDQYKFTGKNGRISITLQQRAIGNIGNTIYKKSVLVKQENGEFKWVKIYCKEKEIWSDKFVFEEYDQHRGLLISDKLDKEEDVSITVVQNGKEFNWTGDLSFLSYGLFKVICKKNNRIAATYDAFCINSSNDVVRNSNNNTYSFSIDFSRGIGGIRPLNPNFSRIGKTEFLENLQIESNQEYTWFANNTDTIRMPIFRVSARAYVVFFNGKAELVNYNHNSTKVILYVPKYRQKDITKINVIDSSGVRGVALEEVTYIHSLLVEANYNKDGYFNLYIPNYNNDEYQFVSYNQKESEIKPITLKIGGRKNQYILPIRSDEVVLQLIDYYNLPDIIFRFSEKDFILTSEWLLGRDVDESIATKRLPDFLYAYCRYKKFNLGTSDYDYLVRLSEELRFNWLFLYPKEWKRIISQNKCMKEILTSLFCYNYPDNIFLQEIISVVLDGVEGSDNYQWVNHRIGYRKQGIGYRALEYLMPIYVQKGKKKTPLKSVNKRNADKVREVDFDPRNRTIKREKSFTGTLFDEDDAERLIEDLKKEDVYTEIYNYMKRLKFVRI